jgi:hypothetical protein
MKGLQVCPNKGPSPLERGDEKNVNMVWGSFKNLKNHWARKAQIYMKAF